MIWKRTGITENQAMEKVIRGIENMVENDKNAAEGFTPVGKSFLDSLMLIRGKWYIWYNTAEGSTGAVRC